jgi:hypothetical protein
MRHGVEVVPDKRALMEAGAAALSGGSTPRALYVSGGDKDTDAAAELEER